MAYVNSRSQVARAVVAVLGAAAMGIAPGSALAAKAKG
jgi:adenine/guanine phosphoribosyltransferase-like PRPP-binding protein